jgi:hypothetical protein
MTLIAEDLLLLLFDDVTGKAVTDRTKLDNALAGAVVLELAVMGRVEQDPGDRRGRLVVTDASPTGDGVLDEALRRIADKQPVKAERVLGGIAKHLRDGLLARLADRGALRRQDAKVLGLFPTTQWMAQDSGAEKQVHQRLVDVLVVGLTPDPRTRALVSLLSAVDAVPRVVGVHHGVEKRELKRRAKALAEGEWAGVAVRKAVEAVNAAVMATVVATTVATSAGSS